MRVLITGGRGRLGRALRTLLPRAGAQVCGNPTAAGHQPDVTDIAAFRECARREKPEAIVHCAAWTDVDGCARQPERANRINALGTRFAAQIAAERDIPIFYISSNEVFSGKIGDTPFHEYDRPQPANPYGRSKWLGEEALRAIQPQHCIVRTAWLYAPDGRNFVQSILVAARAGEPLRVVMDEVANPTSTEDLAAALIALIDSGARGNFHLVNEGACSRYALARFLLDGVGLADKEIAAITRADWPRASCPPPFSALANEAAAALGIRLRPWEEALAEFLEKEVLLRW